ncbi:MAG: ankyrin repeat domain-containing protein, partial [Bacteriovoracales bacterium]
QRIAEQLQLSKELMTVVLAGDLVKFQELIKKGANPAYSDETGLTPLMIAAQKEQKGILTALLKVLDQTAINAVDKEGRNALIWAIVAPNQKPDRDTRAMVRLLLEKNIDVNQKDSKGMTALAYVTKGPFKTKLIEWALKEKGAKL